MKPHHLLLPALILFATAAPVGAQTSGDPDVTALSLEELLQSRIEVVSSASKFAQQVTDAPASITVVTGDEMRRLGHRTVKDLLDGVRGFYTLDDRNYSYVGVRGFARPGDYNTRVLMLVNGHRINDPIYDQARIGNDLMVDVESIDRVEVIRGPGSSLYGTEAFFAVVNIITRRAAGAEGVRIGIGAGTSGLRRGRASVGHVFANGADLFIAATAERSAGNASLFFPEFDTAQTSFGIVRNADGEQHQQISGALSFGSLTVRGAFGNRDKHVPTAAYGTTFGNPNFVTRDRQGMVEGVFDGSFGRGWTGIARIAYDHYNYSGEYPYADRDGGDDPLRDVAGVDWLTSELTLNRRLGSRHVLTTGVEWRQSLHERQYSYDISGITNDDRTHTGTLGVYVQDEFKLLPRLVLNGGFRLDQLARYGSEVAPRAALIYQPAAATALKLLHGRAFRAPNAYELYYYTAPASAPSLDPETVATTEGIWEQYFAQHLRTSLSVFQSRISKLITQQSLLENGGDELYFANLTGAHARGIEGEIEGRWGSVLMTRFSHSLVDAEDADGLRLTNSPQQLSKFAVIVPVARQRASIAVEGQRIGSRLTLDRERLPAAALTNVTLQSDALPYHTQFSLTLHNVFDRRYAVPGAEEHTQHAIEQDGRALRAEFAFGF